MNKKKVIIVSSSISVLIFSFLWFIPIIQYNINNKKIIAIEQQFQDFSKAETREEKFKRLKSLISRLYQF